MAGRKQLDTGRIHSYVVHEMSPCEGQRIVPLSWPQGEKDWPFFLLLSQRFSFFKKIIVVTALTTAIALSQMQNEELAKKKNQ